MMDSNTDYNSLKLSDVEFLTTENLFLFESYNIFTLGQLFGATRGLTITQLFDHLDNKDELIRQLLDLVPPEFTEKNQAFSEEHPTGLIKKQNDEN